MKFRGTFNELVAFSVESFIAEQPRSGDILDALHDLIGILNVTQHHIAALVEACERRGVARKQGRKMREVLQEMGVAPAVTARWLRVGSVTAAMPILGHHAEMGRVSSEHADAIARGFEHVRLRSPEPFDADARQKTMISLLAQQTSGATPAEIAKHARNLGNTAAQEEGGVPAGEDRRLNSLTITPTSDGRVAFRGDLDTVVGEKLITTINALSSPRPEPDGSPDARSTERRSADALDSVLEHVARSDLTLIGAPRTQVLVTIPSDTPDLSRLQYLGPVTARTAELLSCDSAVTTIVVDGESVPLDVGHTKRLFTGPLRKALIVRDSGCIKCGAPAAYTEGHHIIHWSDGGTTSLDNGCLLCPACHTAVHNEGWDIRIGYDRHPWLIPPTTVDPGRTPLRSYARRTMRLDAAA